MRGLHTSVRVILFTWTVVWPHSLTCCHDNTPHTRQLKEERFISAHGSILAGKHGDRRHGGWGRSRGSTFELQVQSRESKLQMAQDCNPQSFLVTLPPTGLYKREKLQIQTAFVHWRGGLILWKHFRQIVILFVLFCNLKQIRLQYDILWKLHYAIPVLLERVNKNS